MLEPVWGTPTWRPKTSGNIWSLVCLSQIVHSLCLTWIHSHRHFSQHIGYSDLENIRQIDVLVHATLCPETMPMSRIVKKNRVLFSKQSGPPSWRQANRYMPKKWLLPDKTFNFSFFWRHVKTKNSGRNWFCKLTTLSYTLPRNERKQNIQAAIIFSFN